MTNEEKKAYLKELFEKAKAQIDNKETAPNFAHNIDGHVYSPFNQFLLIHQNAPNGMFGGFHAWKAKGRQVIKGQHGFFISAPLVKKVKEDSGLETTKMFGLTTATIFHISQTEETPKE